MHSYFKLHKSYQPIYKGQNILINNNILTTSLDNILITTDHHTTQILEKKVFSEKISSLFSYNEDIIIGLTDGTITYKISKKQHKLHKAPITVIGVHDGFLYTGSADKTAKIHAINDMNLLSTVFLRNMATCILVKDRSLFIGDLEGTLYQYDIVKKQCYIYKAHKGAITSLQVLDSYLFSCGRDGKVVKYYFKETNKTTNEKESIDVYLDGKKGETKIGQISIKTLDLSFSIEDSAIYNEMIYLIGESCKLFAISSNLDVKIQSQVLYEEMSYKKIKINDGFLITTDEDEIIFFDYLLNVKHVIIGNNDEITDLSIKNNMAYISTNSSRLRYMPVNEDAGEFCCKAELLTGHSESIMCVATNKNKVLTCSRDASVILWIVNEEEIKRHKSERNYKKELLRKEEVLKTHIESVNSCDITDKIFVSVGKDTTMQIFKHSPTIEAIYTRSVHSKEINFVKINEARMIIGTASQDKTVKLFNYEGKERACLIGHKKGVWSFDFGDEIIATCSTDETIRIWNLNDYSCLKVLEGQNCSVIKVKVFDSDRQLCSSGNDGIIKIWDINKAKIISTLDFHKEKVWSMQFNNFFYTAGADGVINVFADETKKRVEEMHKNERTEKELKFQVEKSLKENKHLEALKMLYKFDDLNAIFRVTCEVVRQKNIMDDLFLIFDEDRSKFIKMVINGLKMFKNSDVVSLLLMNGLQRSYFTQSESVYIDLMKKHLIAANDIYLNLLAYELIFKENMDKI